MPSTNNVSYRYQPDRDGSALLRKLSDWHLDDLVCGWCLEVAASRMLYCYSCRVLCHADCLVQGARCPVCHDGSEL